MNTSPQTHGVMGDLWHLIGACATSYMPYTHIERSDGSDAETKYSCGLDDVVWDCKVLLEVPEPLLVQLIQRHIGHA